MPGFWDTEEVVYRDETRYGRSETSQPPSPAGEHLALIHPEQHIYSVNATFEQFKLVLNDKTFKLKMKTNNIMNISVLVNCD